MRLRNQPEAKETTGKFSSLWMSLPSLVWRDQEGRSEFSDARAGVTPSTQMATAVSTAQDGKAGGNDRGTFCPRAQVGTWEERG